MNGQDDKYGGIFKSVLQFEKSTFPNNPYAVILTDTTKELGAIPLTKEDGSLHKIKTPIYDENKNIIDYDEQTMATFGSEDAGMKAGEHIVKLIYDKTNGDPVKFASRYTGLPEDNEIVQNYASVIRKSQDEQKKINNLSLAVDMYKESKKIESMKDGLMSVYPWAESKIDKAITDGTSYKDLIQGIKRDQTIQRKIWAETNKIDSVWRDLEVSGDALKLGLGGIQKGIGGMLMWGGFENQGQAVVDHANNYMEIASAGAINQYFKDREERGDFKVWDTDSDLMPGKGFWTRSAPTLIPSLVQSIVEGVGIAYATGFVGNILKVPNMMGRFQAMFKSGQRSQQVARDFYKTKVGQEALKNNATIENIPNLVTATTTMTALQGLQEGGRLYQELIEEGIDPEVAGEQAWQLTQDNMKLVPHQMLQNSLLFMRLPNKVTRAKYFQYLNNKVGKGAGVVGKAGVSGTIEGFEEHSQDFWYEQGLATAKGTQDPEFVLSWDKFSPEQKETFVLSFIAGGGFDIAGTSIAEATKMLRGQDIEKIGQEIKEAYQTREEFREQAIKDLQGSLKTFAGRLSELETLKEKLNVLSNDGTIVESVSEDDLRAMNYNPESFPEMEEMHTEESVNAMASLGMPLTSKDIGTRNRRYDKEKGGRQFLISGQGMSPDGSTIIVNSKADPDVLLEEVTESVIKQIAEVDQNFYAELEQEMSRLSQLNTENTGIEALSKAYVYHFLRAGGDNHPTTTQITNDGAFLNSSIATRLHDFFRLNDENQTNIVDEFLKKRAGDDPIYQPQPQRKWEDIPLAEKLLLPEYNEAWEMPPRTETSLKEDAEKVKTEMQQKISQPALPPSTTIFGKGKIESPEKTRVIYDFVTNPSEDAEIQRVAEEYRDIARDKQLSLFDDDTQSFSLDVWRDVENQEFSSVETDVNWKSGRIPTGIKALLFSSEIEESQNWLDFGGGRSDLATNIARDVGGHNINVFDLGRSKEHNLEVVEKVRDGKVDVATMLNLLNVIKEDGAKVDALMKVNNALKDYGKLYIQVYNSKRKGQSGKDSWQEGKALKDYLPVVHSVFPSAYIKTLTYYESDNKKRSLSMIVAEKLPKNQPIQSFNFWTSEQLTKDSINMSGSSHPVRMFRRLISIHQRLAKDGSLNIHYPKTWPKRSKKILWSMASKVFLPKHMKEMSDGTGITITKPKKPDDKSGYRTKKLLSPEVVQFLAMVDPETYADLPPNKLEYRDNYVPFKDQDRGRSGLAGKMDQETYDARLKAIVETAVEEYTNAPQDIFKTLAEYLGTSDATDYVNVALDWYGAGTQEAIDNIFSNELADILQEKISEGSSLELEEKVLKTLVGLTSPDNAVDLNWNLAIEFYKSLHRKGEVIRKDFVIPNGDDKGKIKENVFVLSGQNSNGDYYEMVVKDNIGMAIDRYLKLIEATGSVAKAHEWLDGEWTAQEHTDMYNKLYPKGWWDSKDKKWKKFTPAKALAKIYFEKAYKTNKDATFIGYELFSPKVGSFVANLNGVTSTTTIDLWMARQLHRYFAETFFIANEEVEITIVEQMGLEGSTYRSKIKGSKKATAPVDAPKDGQYFTLMREAFDLIAKDPRIVAIYGNRPGMDYQALGWYLEKAYYQLKDADGQKPLAISDYKGVNNARQQIRRTSPTYSGFGDIEGSNVRITKKRPESFNLQKSFNETPPRTPGSDSKEGTQTYSLGVDSNNPEASSHAHFDVKPPMTSRIVDWLLPDSMSGKKIRDYFRTFSREIGRLSPDLKRVFKYHQRKEIELLKQYTEGLSPFMEKLKALKKKAKKSRNPELRGDYVKINTGVMNEPSLEVDNLLDKYDMKAEYLRARAMLDKIHKDAKMMGLDIGYIEGFFPRRVKYSERYMEYLQGKGGGNWGAISQAIQELQAEKSKDGSGYLTYEEKVQVAQMVLYQRGVNAINNGALKKARQITTISEQEASMFYYDAFDGLGMYAMSMANTLATHDLVGKTNLKVKQTSVSVQMPNGGYRKEIAWSVWDDINNKFVGEPQSSKAKALRVRDEVMSHQRILVGMPGYNLQDTIHGWAIDQVTKHDLTPQEENRLVQLVGDYFAQKPISALLRKYKNLSYIDTIGSLASVITQLGDFAMAVWKGGDEGILRIPTGMARAVRSFSTSMFTNARWNEDFITMDDLGIDIGEELVDDKSWLGGALQRVLTITGFRKLDRVGKESVVNSVIKKYQRASKKGKGKTFDRLMFSLEDNLNKEDRDATLRDLRSGKKTENTIMLAYMEILNVQPVGRTEVPVGYLRMGNGKLFYMLKTFLLKRLDAFHEEMRFIKWKYEKEGNADMKKKMFLAYTQRMTLLGVVLAMGEASADELKDMMYGRTTSLRDRTISNILRLIGLSKYTFYIAKKDGLDVALMKMILPPSDMIHDPYKDVSKWWDKSPSEFRRYVRKYGLKSPKHIPIVGKHLYWYNPKTKREWAKLMNIPMEEFFPKEFLGGGTKRNKLYSKKDKK